MEAQSTGCSLAVASQAGDRERAGKQGRGPRESPLRSAASGVRAFERPWPELATGELDAVSLFGRGEYLLLPWVIASFKAERFTVSTRDLPPGSTRDPAPSESTRLMPGVVLLVRQNVRLAIEGELYSRAPATDERGLARPHGLWMRLDVAF